jgi:hypothetical protein
MSEPKSFASLTPGLLARKGAAKPALRHQLNPDSSTAIAVDEEDYADQELSHAAEVVDIGSRSSVAAVPEVVRQQQSIAVRVAKRPAARRSALADGRNAAFTLRLDAERHLKLRMACTLENRSAQQIVTEALDKLLASLPKVADLAERAGKRR